MHTVKELLQMDPMRSMDATTRKYFSNKHLRQLFNFLIMYIGSSPYHAPAVLTQLAHVQLGLGIYYVKGGMYKIAEAMDKLLQELARHCASKYAGKRNHNKRSKGNWSYTRKWRESISRYCGI